MDTRNLAILAAIAVGTAFYMLQHAAEQAPDAMPEPEPEPQPEAGQGSADLLDEITAMARQLTNAWKPPAMYAGLISEAENRHGLPKDMLARLLYQESRWRNDIITGRLKSPAGAVGIAQFMPATAAEMGIDPLNVPQAINGAARYLATLYRRFGTWTQALAAYNWGQGNVARRGLGSAPLETRNYFTQILADVNASNGTNHA